MRRRSSAAQLKTDPELSHLHVIILSVEDDRSRGYSLGACDYLVKPVEAEQLLSVVRRAVVPASGEVLVVDDDAATRELVCRNLERVGFSTAQATSGEEALLRLRVSSASLVVLDLLMPGLDGFEVLHRMRAEGRMHIDGCPFPPPLLPSVAVLAAPWIPMPAYRG